MFPTVTMFSGINFIHKDHLDLAAVVYDEERNENANLDHCYPFFPVVALTYITKLLR